MQKKGKMSEKALIKSANISRQIAENIHLGIWLIDKDDCIAYVNPCLAEMLGCTVEEIEGKNLFEFIRNNNTENYRENLDNYKQGKKGQHHFKLLRKDGKRIYALLRISPIIDDDGNCKCAIASVQDITERNMMEEKLNESIKEKEALLREIHHRVKNNMQIIYSLLNLQSRNIKNKKALDVLEQCQNRVRSMALIHERLYQSNDLSKIEFGDYIRKLVFSLFHSYGVRPNSIKINIGVENVFLDINTAIPCGLIVNELVSNSLKHAFPNSRIKSKKRHVRNEIYINLHLNISDKYTLMISDNGVGFPKDFNFQKTKSLGLQLVNTLVEQLEGRIRLDSKKGAAFKITFKELKKINSQ